MKSRDGNIYAIGLILSNQQTIHGYPVRKGNVIISIEDVIQAGAKTWYPDKFGEDDIHKGIIVEWPHDMVSKAADPSPMHTRSNKKRI